MIIKIKEIIGDNYGDEQEIWIPDSAKNIEIHHNQIHYDIDDQHDFQFLPIGVYEISN